MVVKQVPFSGGERDQINYFLQDSTGLMWLITLGKWYVSNGEKVIPMPLPFLSDSTGYIKGVYQGDRAGNFYLTGDCLRIYNPYRRKIIRTIGVDESVAPEGIGPHLYNIISGPDSLIWAVYSAGWRADFIILQSRNGAPFKQVIDRRFTGTKFTSNLAVQGDQLFVFGDEAVLQYDASGRLAQTYLLPALGRLAAPLDRQFGPNEAVSFHHYTKRPGTQKIAVAFYSLQVDGQLSLDRVLPDLPGGELSFQARGKEYWLKDEHMSLLRFTEDGQPAKNYTDYIKQQHPAVPYFQDRVIQVFTDRTGTIWATSAGKNIFKFSSTIEPFDRYLTARAGPLAQAREASVIRGMTADDQQLYLGYDYGVKKLSFATKEISEIPITGKDKLRAIYSLSHYQDKLYLNALIVDPETGNTTEILPNTADHHITHLIDREGGQMWLADAGNIYKREEPILLYHYDLSTGGLEEMAAFKTPKGYLNQVSQLHYSSMTNTIFMATIADGLYELNLDGTVVRHLTNSEEYGPFNRILSLFEDDDQQLWIGHSAGLSRLDLKSGEFISKPYVAIDDFQSRQVYSFLRQDEDYCWLGTHRGLYRLQLKTGILQGFRMFPLQASTEYNRLSNFRTEDGTMYFGSVEGLFSFHPDTLVQRARLEEDFKVELLQVSWFDAKADSLISLHPDLIETNKFEVYPRHRSIILDVFVPDYRDAEKNTYTWWLEGYEASWSKPTTTNAIRYDNLPPGKYTLHVKGGVTADYYASSVKEYIIIVHQVWYKTWWAWCLYMGAFLGLVAVFYRYKTKQALEKAETRRLKEMDVFKSRMYTNISHEFRTPLTVIMGMTGNIRGHQEEKNLIFRNSKNLLRLINQLLDLSKLESNTLKLDKVQGDIVSYLRYLTESFYSMAEEKEIRLSFYPETKALTMDFDEVKIQHIIYNLLTNAIKFTQESGKIILHLKAVKLKGSEYLEIIVDDTGIGISSSDLPKIFDRFYQGDNSSTRQEEGTGIGLALTKDLVRMMGGEISVKSTLGEGTIFKVILPVMLGADTPKAEPGVHHSAKETRLSVNKLTKEIDAIGKPVDAPLVLVIDDNRDVVTYIKSILQSSYEVMIARTGQEGIDLALEAIPDIIVSDVMMPVKNGYEVCQFLKNDERTSHIPVILLTAKVTSEDRIEGLQGGADAYLTKPFNKEELQIRLAQLIAIRKSLQKRYSSFGSFGELLVNQPGSVPSLDDRFLKKLFDVVTERMDDTELSVTDLCRAAKLSNSQVNRKLKTLTNKTPSQFVRSIRLQKALELLQTSELNVSEVAYQVGFSDPNYFSRTFLKEFGYPPTAVRK